MAGSPRGRRPRPARYNHGKPNAVVPSFFFVQHCSEEDRPVSRTPRRNQRLRLYDLGNDRCPICLTAFERAAVAAGREVTLEHVPPRGLRSGSIAMCLTCKPCNNTAGEGVDHAATSLARRTTRPTKVRVDFPGTAPLTGYWTPGENGGILVHGRPGVEPQITAHTKFQISVKLPKPRFAAVSHLKSAYLSVFSLLGQHGYRYAESKALLPVRQQIMNPGEEVIQEHFAYKAGDCTPRGQRDHHESRTTTLGSESRRLRRDAATRRGRVVFR